MIKLAICDDTNTELEIIYTFLNNYLETNNIVAEVEKFSSPDTLLQQHKMECFDIYLLDIVMPMVNGIDVAKEIRKHNLSTPIIFFTTSKEYALDAFSVDATQYVLKPLKKEDVFFAIHKAIKQLKTEHRRQVVLQTERGAVNIPVRDIIYCESKGNYQYIYTSNGEFLRCRATLSLLYESLSSFEDFIKLGSSYIINLFYVKQIQSKEVLMTNNFLIPVPRGAYQNLKDAFFNFYCKK